MGSAEIDLLGEVLGILLGKLQRGCYFPELSDQGGKHVRIHAVVDRLGDVRLHLPWSGCCS
jgi:hypothetical protein